MRFLTAHSIVTSSDAAIIANIIASSELDVSAKSTFSTIASLDSSAQKVFSCNATANGVVSIPNTASALSDTIVKASLNVSPSLDSALSSSRTISVATDVFVREAATAQTLLNVAVQSEASASVGMDGVCADAAEAFTAFTNADAVTAIQRGVTCNVGVVVAPGPPIGNFVVRSLPEIRTIYAPADVLLDAYVIASISENRVVKGARPRIGV